MMQKGMNQRGDSVNTKKDDQTQMVLKNHGGGEKKNNVGNLFVKWYQKRPLCP